MPERALQGARPAAPSPDVLDLGPRVDDLREAVLEGLSHGHKYLPCKFLYDERGSRLFDAICDQPEYYPTRTEMAILERHRRDIAREIGPRATVVDLGSGSSRKIDILLASLAAPAAYVPVDISRDYLKAAARRVARDYPDLRVLSVCADYTQRLALPPEAPSDRVVIFFPGSTIGNFSPPEAEQFLRRIGRLSGPDGALLIGVDLDKSPRILEAAYDDAAGVTAEFNLNLLARINRELGADFDLGAFSHRAVYDTARRRVQMHLVSEREQTVLLDGAPISFRAGEAIHTEDSHKYRLEDFDGLARRAGWQPSRRWLDGDELFSVHLLRRAGR